MPVNRNRQIRPQVQCTVDLDGSLKSAFHAIRTLIETYGEDASLSLEEGPYDDDRRLYLYKNMQETDEQYNARIVQEEKYEMLRVERDKKEFERLSKLFGGSV